MSAFSFYPNYGWNAQVTTPGDFTLILIFGNATASLRWPVQQGAIYYRVYAGTSENDMLPVGARLLDNSATVGNLTGPIYYFIVIAEMEDKQTAVSQLAVSAGGVNQLPLVPGPGTLLLTSTASPGASAYEIFIGTAPGQESFTPVPMVQPAVGPWATPVVTTDGTIQFLIQGLAIGPVYYTIIRPVFNEIVGPVSNEQTFLLLTDGVGDILLINRSGLDGLIWTTGP